MAEGLSIKGLQEAQDKNLRRIAALRPSGPFGRVIRNATVKATRYAETVTHVDTGALKGSHRMEVYGLRGRVFIDPSARNPRSGARTSMYGPFEEARGGSHAFYHRTVEEYGPTIAREGIEELKGELL